MLLRFKGGPGSGHFGHRGRPGQVGGSSDIGVSDEINVYVLELKSRFGVDVNLKTTNAMRDDMNILYGGDYWSEGTRGVYDPKSNSILLDEQYMTIRDNGDMPRGTVRNLANYGWAFLIAHEYGHSVDVNNGNISLQNEWEDIADQYHANHEFDFNDEGDFVMFNSDTAISKYSLPGLGYAKYVESFAESFAAYVLRPDWLRISNPDMYDFMRNIEK